MPDLALSTTSLERMSHNELIDVILYGYKPITVRLEERYPMDKRSVEVNVSCAILFIKSVRNVTSVGLREAKDFSEGKELKLGDTMELQRLKDLCIIAGMKLIVVKNDDDNG